MEGYLGKITGADKREQVPLQQASVLGRIGNYTIVSPYGLYADLPNDTLLQEVSESGRVISITVVRPSDTAQGEPVFYHPSTGTRVICRNNGDLDIFSVAGSGKGDVNISCNNANITADTDVNVTCTNANVTATTGINLTAPLTTVTGALTVTGAAIFGATITNLGKDVGSTHGHVQANDSGGSTEAAISGVT